MNRIEPRTFPLAFLSKNIVVWTIVFAIGMGPDATFALSTNILFEQFSRADDIQQKKSSLEKLKASEPSSAYGHFAKGWLCNFERRFDEAIQEYKDAILIRVDFAEAYNGLGNVYYNQNRPEQALTEYWAAVFLNPAYIEAHLNIALLYYQKNRLDQAAASYLTVLQINPKHAVSQNNLGNIYYRQGVIAKAIRAYQAALKINPNLAETHFNLAIAFEDSDQPAEALKEYRAFLRLAKDSFPTKSEQARERVEELEIENSRLKL